GEADPEKRRMLEPGLHFKYVQYEIDAGIECRATITRDPRAPSVCRYEAEGPCGKCNDADRPTRAPAAEEAAQEKAAQGDQSAPCKIVFHDPSVFLHQMNAS